MKNINNQSIVLDSELGKLSDYDSSYNPEKLFSIPRLEKRKEIGIENITLPFFGFDFWNHYEVSWLNEKGKPQVGVAVIVYDCNSPNIIESKSMKLYFNSFNNTRCRDIDALEKIIKNDLEKKVGSEVTIYLRSLHEIDEETICKNLSGYALDQLDVECTAYTVDPMLLFTQQEYVEEILYSDLLKSNCLVTHQPDWGSIQISYRGNKINHAGLLQYIVSFRNHNEFHEQCIERIFIDIMKYCKPIELTVYGRYTRRGGLDINPFRSTNKIVFNQHLNQRLYRQ